MSLAINILEDLISIPSQIDINKEKNIADYLINLLYKYKFDVKTYEYSKDRPNIVATYKFDREGPTIIFNGHMDTMPAENGEKVNVWKTNPFKATIKNEKIYGLGACDMKGGIAGALSAIFKTIEENSGKGTIIVNLVCDEENTSLYGTIPICKNKLIDGDIAIVMEPTECKVCKKQMGNMFFESHIIGIGGHTGLPEGKINPFDIAQKYIEKLKEWVILKRENKNDSQPFINIGRYESGTSSGTIPTECTLYWGTRVMPKDNFEDYVKEIEKITKNFNENLSEGCKITTKLFESGGIDSFWCESDLLNILLKVSNEDESIFCASSDAGFIYNILKIKSCVFGPGSLKQAHLPNEFIEIKQLEKYEKIIYQFLKQ